MPVPTKDAPQAEGAACSGCSRRNVIARMAHHWGLLDRPSDAHVGTERLSEHLKKIYGSEYVEKVGAYGYTSLQRRLDFVLESWIIWRDELSEGQRSLTMGEAYNLAAARLRWQKKPSSTAPIDRSQPSGDRN